MCAEFTVSTRGQDIQDVLSVPLLNSKEWDLYVRLYQKAPAICLEGEQLLFRELSFSLLPKTTPYATFNARLNSWDDPKKRIIPIYEKRTWRKPFEKSRCLVPMSTFVEPVYLGEYAGHMVQFAAPEILFCAGLHSESVDAKTGEVYEGFALLLHTPSPYVLNVGHHRQPFFLNPQDACEWLQRGDQDAPKLYEWLLKHRHLPDLQARRSRAMAKGWEKRIEASRAKLEAEKEFVKLIK